MFKIGQEQFYDQGIRKQRSGGTHGLSVLCILALLIDEHMQISRSVPGTSEQRPKFILQVLNSPMCTAKDSMQLILRIFTYSTFCQTTYTITEVFTSKPSADNKQRVCEVKLEISIDIEVLLALQAAISLTKVHFHYLPGQFAEGVLPHKVCVHPFCCGTCFTLTVLLAQRGEAWSGKTL